MIGVSRSICCQCIPTSSLDPAAVALHHEGNEGGVAILRTSVYTFQVYMSCRLTRAQIVAERSGEKGLYRRPVG